MSKPNEKNRPLTKLKSRSTSIYAGLPLTTTNAIRLIEVQPARSKYDVLMCDILVSSLKNPPPYQALSYSWDGQDKTREILCNGQKMLVTENCFAALRRLRRSAHKRLVWIDAICIDQSSTSERSHQVRVMGEIYGKASQVIVWLGEQTKESQEAFKSIEDFASRLDSGLLPSDVRLWLTKRNFDSIIGKVEKGIRRGQTPEADVSMAALLDLHFKDVLTRSWWSRVWTIQEVAFSEDCVLLCGSKILPWQTFCRVLFRLAEMDNRKGQTVMPIHWNARNAIRASQGEEHVDGNGNDGNRHNILEAFSEIIGRVTLRPGRKTKAADPVSEDFKKFMTEENVRSFDLYPILRRARASDASDPKDKVYALHSIFRQLGGQFPPPDYEHSIVRIYEEVTKGVIEHDKSLALLEQVYTSNNDKGLPSWVPDWSDTKVRDFPQALRRFEASGRSSSRFEFSKRITSKSHSLVVHGVVVDKVEFVGPPMEKGHGIESTETNGIDVAMIVRKWEQMADRLHYKDGQRFHQYLPTRESLEQAFRRTLLEDQDMAELRKGLDTWSAAYLAGLRPDANGSRPRLGQGQQDHAVRPTRADLPTRSASLAPLLSSHRLSLESTSPSISPSPTIKFSRKLVARFAGYRFFTTVKGYMGIAAATTQIGDEVVLISGFRFPMVVHDGRVHKRLRSTAYVHGVMYGEMWPSDERELKEMAFA
ncbi:HET-domain-containing protein [Aulographum hederae CBS 113979]|uniref:HET-domain-containing protein n=1 Tax=Aulographum hederae CBS 113979 TaxID=1176131 RepID=A0A6G1HE00_9PEZI|nr:HET-domain-containing protein [Aulographum hederae CBS 113979]